jgi:hypothetical protein
VGEVSQSHSAAQGNSELSFDGKVNPDQWVSQSHSAAQGNSEYKILRVQPLFTAL